MFRRSVVGLAGVLVFLQVWRSSLATPAEVRNVRVLRAIPALDQAAIDAVRQWEYEPTLLDGQPVPII